MNEEVTTQGRRSLRRYSAEDRERLIAEQARSGQTKRAFCLDRGIRLQTFYGWSKSKSRKTTPAFAEVAVAAQAAPAAVEVLLPNGARIGIRHQGKRDDLIALVRGVAGC